MADLPLVSLNGVTRVVITWRGVAIKFPKPKKWANFLRGLIANINERDTWKFNSGKYERGHSRLLAPVIWCSWGGWILLMERATLPTEQQWHEGGLCIQDHIKHFKGDDNIENYGFIKERLVKIDYGERDYWKTFEALSNEFKIAIQNNG